MDCQGSESSTTTPTPPIVLKYEGGGHLQPIVLFLLPQGEGQDEGNKR